jgi:hypothetical protein
MKKVTDGIQCNGRNETHLATPFVDLIDDLDSIQVINTGIKTNLVHYDDTSCLRFRIQLPHSWGNVASSDYMCLAFDCGLNYGGVIGVGDKGDNDIIGCDFLFKSSVVVDIQGNSGCPWQIVSQFLGFCECSAGYNSGGKLGSPEKRPTVLTNRQMVPGITDDVLGSRTSDKTAAKEKNLLLYRSFRGDSLERWEYILPFL